jgi:Protein of unknown function (DUF4245)
MWLSDMAVIVASAAVGRMGHVSETSNAGGGRYTRSTGGLVGAMVVTVIAVVGFWALNALKTDHDSNSTPAVDYTAMMRAGRADHKLHVMAPTSLPAGWKATSATYQTGTAPGWHLGVLTDDGKYVGVEEALGGVKDLVEKYVDNDAVQGKDVTIGGQRYQTWTDVGGDYAVTRSVRIGGGDVESYLVGGSAPEAAIRDFAAGLKGGSIRPPG